MDLSQPSQAQPRRPRANVQDWNSPWACLRPALEEGNEAGRWEVRMEDWRRTENFTKASEEASAQMGR